MNCQEALDLLYDIIDKEASEIDADEVQKHLEGCRNCLKIYQLEEHVQALLCEKVRGDGSSPRLEGLREKIILKLDNIDREGSPGHPPKLFGVIAKSLVAAAAVVILIGAVSIGYGYYQHSKYYGPLEAAHLEVLDPAWIPPTDTELPAYQGMDFSQLGLDEGFVLISCCDRQVGEVGMRHLVYRNAETTVSVFAAANGEYTIPPDCTENAVVHNGVTYYCHQCHDCRLLFHEVGNAVVIAASNVMDYDLYPFSPVEDVVLTTVD